MNKNEIETCKMSQQSLEKAKNNLFETYGSIMKVYDSKLETELFLKTTADLFRKSNDDLQTLAEVSGLTPSQALLAYVPEDLLEEIENLKRDWVLVDILSSDFTSEIEK